MKQQWIKLSTRLDAMTLRERVMVFGAVAAIIIFLAYTMALEPLLARQSALLAQVNQQQNQIAGIDTEITQKASAFVLDPDAAGHRHLQDVRQQINDAGAALRAMQKGLVPPDRIAPLLEQLLHGNGKLRLLSMKTLPVTGLSEGGFAADDKSAKPPADTAALSSVPPAAGAQASARPVTPPPTKPHELLYRHGVEIELQGAYGDMVNYMAALEALPAQLFWGKARLDAQQYPNATLTLTLYTMSLDPDWMTL